MVIYFIVQFYNKFLGGNDLIKILEKDEELLKQPKAAEAVEETKTLFKYLEILGITDAV